MLIELNQVVLPSAPKFEDVEVPNDYNGEHILVAKYKLDEKHMPIQFNEGRCFNDLKRKTIKLGQISKKVRRLAAKQSRRYETKDGLPRTNRIPKALPNTFSYDVNNDVIKLKKQAGAWEKMKIAAKQKNVVLIGLVQWDWTEDEGHTMIACIINGVMTITDPGRGYVADKNGKTSNHTAKSWKLITNTEYHKHKKAKSNFEENLKKTFGLKSINWGPDNAGGGPLTQGKYSCAFYSIVGILFFNAGVRNELPEVPEDIVEAIVNKLFDLADRNEPFTERWDNKKDLITALNDFLEKLFEA